jgi:hypothetical protein
VFEGQLAAVVKVDEALVGEDGRRTCADILHETGATIIIESSNHRIIIASNRHRIIIVSNHRIIIASNRHQIIIVSHHRRIIVESSHRPMLVVVHALRTCGQTEHKGALSGGRKLVDACFDVRCCPEGHIGGVVADNETHGDDNDVTTGGPTRVQLQRPAGCSGARLLGCSGGVVGAADTEAA